MKNLFKILILAMTLTSLSSCGSDDTIVLIETNMGNMKLKLYNDTPLHRDNFIKLAKEGFYDDLLFHRVINGFMIQGGDPDSKDAAPTARLGAGGPGYRIPAEIKHPHLKGTLAAARTGGPSNPEKESSGSQFYIVQGRQVNDNQLNSMEQRTGVKYTEEQRRLYKEMGGTIQLDGDYTVYGEMIEGFDVLDKIAATKTAPGDRPVQDVKMKVSVQ